MRVTLLKKLLNQRNSSYSSIIEKLSRENALPIIAILLWLFFSTIFLIPIWFDPTLAVQSDDYWLVSEWFSSSGPYPFSHFGPGFPFLIFLMRSMGIGMFGVAVILKLMVAITGIAIYKLGRALGLTSTIAFCAATAYTIFPVTQVFSSSFFSEPPYLMLISIGVSIIFTQIKKPREDVSLGWLILGYGAIGLAALVRVNASVLLIGCFIIGLFTLSKKKLVVAVLIALIPVLYWSTLNWLWYGQFRLTSSGDAAIAVSIVGPVMCEREGRKYTASPTIWIDDSEIETFPSLFEYSVAVRKMAIEYAINHPGAVILGNVKGWFKSLMGPAEARLQNIFGESSIIWIGVSLIVRATLLIGLIGFFITGGIKTQPAFAVFLCVMLIAHILTAGAAGQSRFGYPVDAFSIVALALFVQNMLSRWRKRLTENI
ncbi:MAG TPA: hypothetical protein PLP93_09300 [Nitrosomonas sp.]|nr:hypothetical protein [Nitrosomonas sp.]HRB33338.1 hypothetical protein [Nitrosomonas sp.]HRB45950.1 hypothetical protein [Nitrosomonas sp.]HRB77952.1 hypothetical protein [Nitrosomonas sp.]